MQTHIINVRYNDTWFTFTWTSNSNNIITPCRLNSNLIQYRCCTWTYHGHTIIQRRLFLLRIIKNIFRHLIGFFFLSTRKYMVSTCTFKLRMAKSCSWHHRSRKFSQKVIYLWKIKRLLSEKRKWKIYNFIIIIEFK